MISQTWIRLVSVRNARMNARIIELTWVAITTRWRFQRSATIPPIGATRNTGIWLAKPTVPNNSVDPVMRYTSHDWATVCIHVPTSEINCPAKNNWKLRCRNARTAVATLDRGDAGDSEIFLLLLQLGINRFQFRAGQVRLGHKIIRCANSQDCFSRAVRLRVGVIFRIRQALLDSPMQLRLPCARPAAIVLTNALMT